MTVIEMLKHHPEIPILLGAAVTYLGFAIDAFDQDRHLQTMAAGNPAPTPDHLKSMAYDERVKGGLLLVLFLSTLIAAAMRTFKVQGEDYQPLLNKPSLSPTFE